MKTKAPQSFMLVASCQNYMHKCADGETRECEGGQKENAALRLAFGVGKLGLCLGGPASYQDSNTTTRNYWIVSRPLTPKAEALIALAHIATGTSFIIEKVPQEFIPSL